MGTRGSYSYEVKIKAIEMKLVGVSTKLVLNIRNKIQVETWMCGYNYEEIHRFE